MICEKCGVVYNGNFCPNGCNVPGYHKPKKPIYTKWWFWIIIVFVGLIIISSLGDNEDVPTQSDPSLNSSTEQIETSNIETSPVESTSIENDNIFYVGETIDANGLKITYQAAEKWEGYNQYLKPAEGYQYIRIKLSVKNTASTDRYISSFEFTCYADGKKEEMNFLGDKILEGGSLSSGRITEGYIYFSVPSNASEIEVEYETDFWSDKKAVLKVEI